MRRLALPLTLLCALAWNAPQPRVDEGLPNLSVTPSEGTVGSVLTITGIDFGPAQRSRRLALKAAVATMKSMLIELEVTRWEPDLVEARIPAGLRSSDKEFHVTLMDRTGRTIALCDAPFKLAAKPSQTKPSQTKPAQAKPSRTAPAPGDERL